MNEVSLTLEQQREEYSRRRFLAMPLAGLIMWTGVAVLCQVLPSQWHNLVMYMLVGNIFYLGAFISKFTGEDFFKKDKPKNVFDKLFLATVAMALMVFAIAIPFALVLPESLPLSLGIMTGLMWLPHSYVIQHWNGYFHSFARTILVTAAWYVFPEERYLVIPLIVIVLYVVSITVFEMRWRKLQGEDSVASPVAN